MTEWTDPRYAQVVDCYKAAKAEAGPPVKRPGRNKRFHGDPFVVVVDPATLKPYTVNR